MQDLDSPETLDVLGEHGALSVAGDAELCDGGDGVPSRPVTYRSITLTLDRNHRISGDLARALSQAWRCQMP
ncbi:hypothetical protein [Kutzneria buriramensis]|uniref:Uncharacterized protein n=1 Tax=Kutzneria buriramensis TaxID=1045776 RepID=A0A3E0G5N7_9PSEU|nr:hypothetical protein [Kutzneria buriramensis]REH17992.1 hypothetical protein BCF44_13924 [Kutzneria buriramensis]